jgi:phosphonopyruvate decarboxylase
MARDSVGPHELRSASGPRRAGRGQRRDFGAGERPRLTRAEALARVIAGTADPCTIVIATTGYTGRELYALADRANHLYVVGSMGCASALGLGLACARPDLRVVVVDGDGAALMRMGNLATIGAYAASNFVHLLLDNEVHESTGGQATVSANVDFAGVARACGYASAHAGNSLDLIDALLDAGPRGGPCFGHLKILSGTRKDLPRPAISPPQALARLCAHIGPPP